MKNILYITRLIIIAFSLSISAQNSQVKIYYMSKSKINTNFGQGQLSEAQKARMKEMQNQASSKNHVLVFKSGKSLFSEEVDATQNIEQSSDRNGGGGYRQLLFNQSSGTYYMDTVAKTYVAQKEIYGKQFLIKDDLPIINWEHTNEVKNIGKYLCFKAVSRILKQSDDLNVSTEETIVTAWYTIEIPFTIGPELYWGLPGAILELDTENRVYLSSKIEINPEKAEAINAPKKGKKVSQEEYDELLTEKTKEIKELGQNRRFGGSVGKN